MHGRQLTSEDTDYELHIIGEAFDLVEVGNSENRHILVAVHLRHKVGVMRQVVPGEEEKKNT